MRIDFTREKKKAETTTPAVESQTLTTTQWWASKREEINLSLFCHLKLYSEFYNG